MSGRVFVAQRPAYYHKGRRGWVNKYDLSPAKAHGRLVFLMPPGNVSHEDLGRAVPFLREQLKDYGAGDHIMAVGDPVVISAAVLAAGAASGGRVSLLKWDRITETYEPYFVDVS